MKQADAQVELKVYGSIPSSATCDKGNCPSSLYLHSLHRQHLTDYNTLVISILYFITTHIHTTPNLHLSYTGAYSPRFFIYVPDICPDPPDRVSDYSVVSVRLFRGKCPTTPW